MLDLEDRRLNRTFPVAIQTEPLVHDIGLQTEFFIPPVSAIRMSIPLISF